MLKTVIGNRNEALANAISSNGLYSPLAGRFKLLVVPPHHIDACPTERGKDGRDIRSHRAIGAEDGDGLDVHARQLSRET